MDKSRGEAGDVTPKKSKANGFKQKSCKGYLFYSTALKSKSRNPRCFGIPRTFPEVPRGVIQTETLIAKDGENITDFCYSCLGYSMYMDGMNKASEEMPRIKDEANTQLPVCVGLQAVVTRVSSDKPAPAQAPNEEEDTRQLPILEILEDDFRNRFTKSASVVAYGVARDLLKVGSYINSSVEDIIFPDRRQPK